MTSEGLYPLLLGKLRDMISLQNKFIERSALSKYSTRNMKDLQKPKLAHTKKVFCKLVLKAWNSIPQLIRDTESVVIFKKDLKSHLMSSY